MRVAVGSRGWASRPRRWLVVKRFERCCGVASSVGDREETSLDWTQDEIVIAAAWLKFYRIEWWGFERENANGKRGVHSAALHASSFNQQERSF